ncbi:ribosomal protein S18-alanine N-acetyltransferase [bacterium]|uniref:Ribosomal-protein-alanine N-acetyltransferase n=1 Tax=Candidatus Nealsonbacteria bacterium CG_4_9_14_3_um_filter_37_29 TaxID=1974696 RepID=A0A2M7Z3B5_9BACT|nr:ribosomal protein S18-alanine N-acetyltransferase [bacterium]PJA83248.1 MAG: ribosomal-protein-alanine N-acetyltransferase [Candidatus Nealsonbacteria bacterium CG_4_9_14_3_um_filter_37_29]
MIKIREVSLSDLNEVLEIERASFPKKQVYSKSRFERYSQKCPESFIVAESEDEVVGYTIGKSKNERAEIISLAVRPDFRQKGIGRELTIFLISHFKKRGAKEIFLEVRTGNKTAISFYKNLGFKILKEIKNYYRNGDDAYLMKLSLHLNPRSASPRSGI